MGAWVNARFLRHWCGRAGWCTDGLECTLCTGHAAGVMGWPRLDGPGRLTSCTAVRGMRALRMLLPGSSRRTCYARCAGPPDAPNALTKQGLEDTMKALPPELFI